MVFVLHFIEWVLEIRLDTGNKQKDITLSIWLPYSAQFRQRQPVLWGKLPSPAWKATSFCCKGIICKWSPVSYACGGLHIPHICGALYVWHTHSALSLDSPIPSQLHQWRSYWWTISTIVLCNWPALTWQSLDAWGRKLPPYTCCMHATLTAPQHFGSMLIWTVWPQTQSLLWLQWEANPFFPEQPHFPLFIHHWQELCVESCCKSISHCEATANPAVNSHPEQFQPAAYHLKFDIKEHNSMPF